jgi:hypothetical protein
LSVCAAPLSFDRMAVEAIRVYHPISDITKMGLICPDICGYSCVIKCLFSVFMGFCANFYIWQGSHKTVR